MFFFFFMIWTYIFQMINKVYVLHWHPWNKIKEIKIFLTTLSWFFFLTNTKFTRSIIVYISGFNLLSFSLKVKTRQVKTVKAAPCNYHQLSMHHLEPLWSHVHWAQKHDDGEWWANINQVKWTLRSGAEERITFHNAAMSQSHSKPEQRNVRKSGTRKGGGRKARWASGLVTPAGALRNVSWKLGPSWSKEEQLKENQNRFWHFGE